MLTNTKQFVRNKLYREKRISSRELHSTTNCHLSLLETTSELQIIEEACNYNKNHLFVLSRGTSITLKLSPNLRLPCKPPKKQQWLDQLTLQVQKLDRLLSLVRELPEGGETVQDTATEVASH